jgi:hypothetical protein
MMRFFLPFAAFGLVALLLPGCAANTPGNPIQQQPNENSGSARALLSPRANQQKLPLQTPALIAVSRNGVLKDYPVTTHGGNRPQIIGRVPKVSAAGAMVANGHVVAIVNQAPTGVVVYNIKTKATQSFPDPYGIPIDIAIDKNANLYALNYPSPSNVAMYRAGSSQPQELTCKYLDNGVAVATDNEGDVFVNSYGSPFTGVVEIPNGPGGPQSQNCKELAGLLPEQGYEAGLAVDPKTDDLIVLDDPDECAGGIEGLMTIYPKPYSASTAHSVNLNGNCVGLMRLDASSSTVFAFDESVDQARSYIIQRSYPQGRGSGAYRGGHSSGFTTIPNTLPN